MKRIKAIVDVVYDDELDEASLTAIKDGIADAIRREVGNGMLTCGDPEQTVDTWELRITDEFGS